MCAGHFRAFKQLGNSCPPKSRPEDTLGDGKALSHVNLHIQHAQNPQQQDPVAALAVLAEGAMLGPREDLAGLNAELQQLFDRSDCAREEAEKARVSLGVTHQAVKELLNSGALARADLTTRAPASTLC